MLTIKKLHTLKGHKEGVYALAYHQNSLYSASADGYVVQWNLATFAGADEPLGKVIANIANSCYALCVLPTTNGLVFGHNTDGIHLLDLGQQKEVFSAGFTNSAVFDIQQYAQWLVVACGDGNVMIIDWQQQKLHTSLQCSDKSARCVAIAPNKKEIAVGYSDAMIRVFDSQTFALKQEWVAHQNSIFSLTYALDETYLLSGSRDAHLKVWKTEFPALQLSSFEKMTVRKLKKSYSLHQDIIAHLFTINHIAYNPDGQTFATCSKDKAIKLWSAADFRLLKVIDKGRYAGHGTSINKLCWLNKHLLASASDDTTVVIWEIELSKS